MRGNLPIKSAAMADNPFFSFTLPGNPKTKKNSARILRNAATRRPFVAPSKAFTAYQTECGRHLPQVPTPIDYPVNLKCVYYMATRRRVDLCNLLAATCDILTHYGVLADDNAAIVAAHDGSRVSYDKTAPRVEVEITPLWEKSTCPTREKKS